MLWGTRRSVDATARRLRSAYDALAAAPDLRPGPRVDAMFRDVVRVVVATPEGMADAVLHHPALRDVVPHFRELCGDGEYLLEFGWAERIAAADDPAAELERFPYVDNYRRLSVMEAAALAGVGAVPPVRVAVIGSGPLPLTSFLLAGEGGAQVDNIERNVEALTASRRAADALGVAGLGFHLADVGGGPLAPAVALGDYDLVVLAALVGLTPVQKRRAIAHVATHMTPGALLLARSARGVRTLLYPAVDRSALAGFDVLGVIHPTDDVINSVILARARRPRKDP